MGKFDDIAKILSDLDHKYHFDEKKEKSESDALIKHIEEEYKKEQENKDIK